MRGLHPFPEQLAEMRENWRVQSEVDEELYFNPTFSPGDGIPGLRTGAVNAVFDPQTVSGTPTVEFPATAGGQPAWRINKRRRSRWRNAGIRMKVMYTATAGSTNNFQFQVIIRSWSGASVAPGQTDLAVGFTMPGPAVAQTWQMSTYVNMATTVVPGNLDWMTFFFWRDKTNAADTNVNSLYVGGIHVEIIPA